MSVLDAVNIIPRWQHVAKLDEISLDWLMKIMKTLVDSFSSAMISIWLLLPAGDRITWQYIGFLFIYYSIRLSSAYNVCVETSKPDDNWHLMAGKCEKRDWLSSKSADVVASFTPHTSLNISVRINLIPALISRLQMDDEKWVRAFYTYSFLDSVRA